MLPETGPLPRDLCRRRLRRRLLGWASVLGLMLALYGLDTHAPGAAMRGEAGLIGRLRVVALPGPAVARVLTDRGRPRELHLWGLSTQWGGAAAAVAARDRWLASQDPLWVRVHSRGSEGFYLQMPDGALLNERLLAVGLACCDPGAAHPRAERFELLETQARWSGRGLWADPPVGQ